MIDKEHITKALKDNKVDLATRYHLTSIGIFGSFTREDFHDDSDIDILIVIISVIRRHHFGAFGAT